MLLCQKTYDSAASNVALDEALLEQAEASATPQEVLRLWHPTTPFVVVGRGSSVESEVRLDRCLRLGVPVVRRASGGLAIVTGPGCLMYSLVLSYEQRPELRDLDKAHGFVLAGVLRAVRSLLSGVSRQGTSDLTHHGRKFSGNAVRCKRRHLLYHGTLLCAFDLTLIEECLAQPSREPDYRAGRKHEQFVMNLGLPVPAVESALSNEFGAHEELSELPTARLESLLADKYAFEQWQPLKIK